MSDIRHIHLDAIGGVAGDMFVASMVAALPDLQERVVADCRAVLPPGVSPEFSEGHSNHILAKRFSIIPDDSSDVPAPESANFRSMCARIEAADLSPGTAARAISILTRIARVEARIHSVPLEKVHFHEIADWDSLADVVAAGSIAAALEGTEWTVSALPMGSGVISTRHGTLPALSPAAASLLEGFEFRDDKIPGERVTPTGVRSKTMRSLWRFWGGKPD